MKTKDKSYRENWNETTANQITRIDKKRKTEKKKPNKNETAAKLIRESWRVK